jgi:hypothetical protein
MRTFSLLMVLLCGLGLVREARAAEPQNSPTQAAVISFNSDLIRPSAMARQDFDRAPAEDRADYYSRSDLAHDGEVTCYTMHTFLVKRESPHSDVTEPAGEATCLFGPRYSVRKSEERDKAPSR